MQPLSRGCFSSGAQDVKSWYMPESWWGKTLLWGYTAGYCIDLGATSFQAWPKMAFMPWLYYVTEQSTWACFWPISIVHDVIGL